MEQVTIGKKEYDFLRKSLVEYGILLDSLAATEESYEYCINNGSKNVVDNFNISSRLDCLNFIGGLFNGKRKRAFRMLKDF